MSHQILGAPLPRQDGPVKVTGAARYAADRKAENLLNGVIVGAPAPAGRIRTIHTGGALATDGVTHVLTKTDFPRLRGAPVPPASSIRMPFQDDEIRFHGEPIALVLAETLEAAEYGATLVAADIEAAEHIPHPAPDRENAVPPRESTYLFFGFTDFEHGDTQSALGAAAVRQQETYVQPSRHHNPMEPSATLAEWHDGNLTMVDAVQGVFAVQAVMATVFGVEPERIRVQAPHTGGGFGCKGFVWPHQIIAAAAARVVERPVRIALSRAQMYATVAYQPQIVQTVALGADAQGQLAAIDHESINVTSVSDDFCEYATEASRTTYAAPAIRLRQRVQRANVNLPNPMRAPVEGCGLWGLGSAMNELAESLNVDPVELRLRNYAETHPVTGQPCHRRGCAIATTRARARSGGARAPANPSAMAPGSWARGWPTAQWAASGVRPPPECDCWRTARPWSRPGPRTSARGPSRSSRRSLPSFSASSPGLVSLRMGDTSLPAAGMTAGSSSTMGVGSAVMAAAQDVLARLSERLGRDLGPAPGAGALAAGMREAGLDELAGEGSFAPEEDSPYAFHTFGAIFVDVGVDPELGIVRLRRVGRYSAGRIVNPRTARAQMIGGIVWGWGKATMEASHHDPHLGR